MRRSQRSGKSGSNKALEKLKRVRDGERPLDLLEDKEDDMYEEVEEREYLLRRQKDNKFIEDDDGSGYIDYGQREMDYFTDEENDTKTIGSKKQKTNQFGDSMNPKNSIQKFLQNSLGRRAAKTVPDGEDDFMKSILNEVDTEFKSSGIKSKRPFTFSKNVNNMSSTYDSRAIHSVQVKREPMDDLPSDLQEKCNISTEFMMEEFNDFDVPPEIESGLNIVKDEPNHSILKDEPHQLELNIEDAKEVKFAEPIDEPILIAETQSDRSWVHFQNNMLGNNLDEENVQDEAPQVQSTNKDALYMYWIDAHAIEAKGIVYLIGKTYDQEKQKYVSACVVVSNIERNLYFLPNPPIDSELDINEKNARMIDFINEISPLWVKAYGKMEFSCKRVTRGYAFDTPSNIPKQTEYYKMKYIFKDRSCNFASFVKGDTFSHLFGANTSALELFLIKRKLMGPCWLKIANANSAETKQSYCKLEYTVPSPKSVITLADDEIQKYNLTTPPFNIMSLSIKTVLNKKTNTNEIAMVNLTIFPSVKLDEDTPTEKRHVVRIGAVNQLPNTYIAETFKNKLTAQGFEVSTSTSERALLSFILSRIIVHDPDVFVGHNFLGFGLEVLLNRLEKLNLPNWTVIGRLKRTTPLKNLIGTGHLANYTNRNLINGRIICDTYLGAKDAVKSKSYSLAQLSQDLLNITKEEIDFETIQQYYAKEETLIHLFRHSDFDAYLSAALLFKLQLLPLSKQLTNLAGNLWNHTITGARAKRNEFLLLHEFHKLKYICPDKKPFTKDSPEDENEQEGDNSTRRKAAYSGGLVLDPKRGLYDNLVLLLDFNSLYPSIIQEYNICFTTVDRDPSTDVLPGLPAKELQTGLLPKLLSTLIERRGQVKKLLKDKSISASKARELDIRQKALKLTANSMYGCLGYPLSRFYAKQLAMLITSKGREILQSTVELANNDGLEVVYGDTDSIMINTHTLELAQAKQIAHQFKKKVNQKYKNLEIDIDGVFKNLLLLQKKKYAALVIQENGFDRYKTFIEAKGLDLVRREFCELSQEMSQHILNCILSGKDRDATVADIHEYLTKMGKAIVDKEIPPHKFKIFKSISKPLDKYQDVQSQPQVQVALRIQKTRGTPFMKGDTVDYLICKTQDEEINRKSYAMRAFSFDEFNKSNNTLEIDFEWYLTRQILPPISRLCDCIEGTSSGKLADCLGLDASKYERTSLSTNEQESILDSLQSEAVRFSNVKPLELYCKKCEADFKFNKFAIAKDQQPILGATCPTCQTCIQTFYIQNKVENTIRKHISQFNHGWLKCSEPICGNKTRYVSLQAHPTSGKGKLCGKQGCEGMLYIEFTAHKLYNTLCYYLHLFDKKSNLKSLTSSGIDSNLAQDFISKNNSARKELYDTINEYIKLSAQRYVNLKSIFKLVG